MLDQRRNVGQVARVICEACSKPLLFAEEVEFNHRAKQEYINNPSSYGYVELCLPHDVCKCPEPGPMTRAASENS